MLPDLPTYTKQRIERFVLKRVLFFKSPASWQLWSNAVRNYSVSFPETEKFDVTIKM